MLCGFVLTKEVCLRKANVRNDSNLHLVIPQPRVMTGKRPYRANNRYGEPPPKKQAASIKVGGGFKWNLQALANAADSVECGGKSPVSALNELGVRVTYSVLRQGGPAHCPSFTMAVTVADMTFEGWGHSKREARAAAARACLAAFLARAGRVMPTNDKPQDFTADENLYSASEFQSMDTTTSETVSIPDMSNQIKNKQGNSSPAVTPSPGAALFGSHVGPTSHKSPINLLYENYPGLTFTCTFGDGSPLDSAQAPLQLAHSMRFKVVCQIKEQKFEGYGSSKKLAKLAAARSALAVLEERRVEPLAPHHPARTGFLHQTLADHIANIINEKFSDMMKLDVMHSKRKALAGIVITINNNMKDARVIAVTTGTKCVSGEHMSVRGRAVNDCHAEVAARRCLQRHLYAELLKYASQPDPRVPILESDLEPVAGGGYQLKPNRQVHLYISTAPCGDGRIFSPHEQHEPEPDRHPNRLARGQLRTKIESGEGTIPVKNSVNTVQTWDGVMQGERLLTMSCSDKVARWCVVGLQGALLSRVLRPVYLHSLVLGSLLHPHHMYRAICGRIEAFITSLPPPYRLQRPLLARAASTEARTPARAPTFSVCWCCTTPDPEVLNATTGKLENGQPSLLCKQSMFARWQHVVRRLPQLPQITCQNNQCVVNASGRQELDDVKAPAQLPSNLESLLYKEAKQMCPVYQAAKERLFEAFENAKLGRWIKKPIEQDQFVCELVDADPKALFA
ncbi:double-stranded RNA-specific editase Adar isoform X4 [Manduca sexta]|uniref:double-stranded RNA-specific editase Adar isoform X4 n=1 Tax=Manduca sexta TaxID=7130 RepID=UPI00188E61B7|nr:double-stranded RNA-specific editase Adar isoform X4 [Manduca sexta]